MTTTADPIATAAHAIEWQADAATLAYLVPAHVAAAGIAAWQTTRRRTVGQDAARQAAEHAMRQAAAVGEQQDLAL